MKKTVLWSVGGVLAVLLLAGAAFLAMKWMNAQASGQPFELGSLIPGGGGIMGTTSFTLDMEPAKEIPQEKSDVSGAITEKKDSSLMIGTSPKIAAVAADGEEPVINTEIQGPTYEVVVTKETQIYRDSTFDDQMPQSGEKVQQIVNPITFEDIPNNAMASVWGDKRGDRVIARVVLVWGGGITITTK